MSTITALPTWAQIAFWGCVAINVASGGWIAAVAVRDHLERKWDRQAEARAECNARTLAHIAETDPTFRWLDPANAQAEANFRWELGHDELIAAHLDVWGKDGAR